MPLYRHDLGGVVNRCELADTIIDTIGFTAASRFFSHYGGIEVKIPTGKGKPGLFVTRLIDLLGEEGYQKLTAVFGGESISVPKGKAAALIVRNRKIVEQYGSGISVNDLARHYDLTTRQIRTILGRPTE